MGLFFENKICPTRKRFGSRYVTEPPVRPIRSDDLAPARGLFLGAGPDARAPARCVQGPAPPIVIPVLVVWSAITAPPRSPGRRRRNGRNRNSHRPNTDRCTLGAEERAAAEMAMVALVAVAVVALPGPRPSRAPRTQHHHHSRYYCVSPPPDGLPHSDLGVSGSRVHPALCRRAQCGPLVLRPASGLRRNFPQSVAFIGRPQSRVTVAPPAKL